MFRDKDNLLSGHTGGARNLTLKINYSDELCGEYFPGPPGVPGPRLCSLGDDISAGPAIPPTVNTDP